MKKIINHLQNYCLKNIDSADTDYIARVRAMIIVWISTTIIMWFYVWFSYTVYDFPIVGQLGLIYTIIHCLAPIIFKKTRSFVLAGLTISLSALFFQVTFCIFNGGIDSPSAIWFTAHPVIMSFFGSRRLIVVSIFLNASVVLGLTFLGRAGYFPPDALPKQLTEWMTISSLILLDVVIATYTIVFINTTTQSQFELKNRNELIEFLVKSISHDINNSLTVSSLSVEGLNKILEKENLDSKVKERIEKFMAKLVLANSQIHNITSTTRIWIQATENKLNLKKEKLLISDFKDYIQTNFVDIALSKNVNLIVESNLSNDEFYYGDRNILMFHVLNNLISNAIKFTPEGKNIYIIFQKDNFNFIMIIKDQGIGLEKEALKIIFDPHKNISKQGLRGESGSGMGLPLVKHMLDSHDGKIHVQSQIGLGTEFKIELPI